LSKSIAVLCALLLGGCATIVRGTTETVSFDSQPSGAEVRLSTGGGCVTPCTIVVKRSDEFVATFTKAGYVGQQVEVKTQVSNAGAAASIGGNLVFGGLIGGGVDIASGAPLDHTPNPVIVALKPESRPEPPPSRRPVASAR
jgi:hypothetical protein